MREINTERNAQLQRLYRDYLTRHAPARFDFSRLYPDSIDAQTLLDQVDDLKKSIDSFRPLDPAQTQQLDQELAYRYTYDSNRIEGNTLTLRETTLILEKGVTIAGKSLREHLEVINHIHAFDYIKQVAQGNFDFSEHILSQIHQLVLTGIDPKQAGVYRTFDVATAGSRHIPPPHYIVPQEMRQYFEFYEQNKQDRHPVLLAADLHEKLVTIHPFADGNGRTAQLVMNLILLQHGYPVANISGDADSRMEYYAALEEVNLMQQSERFYAVIANAIKQSAIWHLQFISTIDDSTKGEYFFSRLAPYLEEK